MNDIPTLRVGFVLSTEVGLKTQYLNLRRGLTNDLGVAPEWIVVDWWRPDGLIERMPGVPAGVKARLRAQQQLRCGLDRGPFDALYIGQVQILHGLDTYLRRQPYFVAGDVTAAQLIQFGRLYGKTASCLPLYERRKHLGRIARYQAARALFPWSCWVANSLVRDYGVDCRRIHVIPPGVDLEQWLYTPRTLDNGPVQLLFVGADFYRKGGDLLLHWAATTRAGNWQLHLVTRDVIPDPPPGVLVYRDLHAHDPALMALYRQAHLLVLPTRADCYSLVALEAMASGIPVVLSRTGGTEDILQDGVTGFLIAPSDRDALARCLDDLLSHPEELLDMGRAARQAAERRFDARENMRQTIEIVRHHLSSGD